MPVASFVVTGTALRAAPGRPFPSLPKPFLQICMQVPLSSGHPLSRGQGRPSVLLLPLGPQPRLPQVDAMVHSGGNTACPVPHPANAKAPGRCDRALFMPKQGQSCRPPSSPGDWPSFSACGVTPPARDQNKSFGKGEGSLRGEGGPFSKRVSLSPS